MKSQISIFSISIILFLILFAASYIYLWNSDYLNILKQYAENNLAFFLICLFSLKVLSIVWPPLPGGLITLAAIPFIGWSLAFAVDFTGSVFGSSVTYFMGKKYGQPILNKMFGAEITRKVKNIKVKDNRQTELIIMLRIFTGSLFLEAITYGAGVIGIRYSSFLAGTVISHLIVGLPVYYFASFALINTRSLGASAVMLVVIIIILYKVKGRYLE